MISWRKNLHKRNSKQIFLTFCCHFLCLFSHFSLLYKFFYRLLLEISDVLERVEVRQKELEQENEKLKEELRRSTSLLASRDFELRAIREKMKEDDLFESLIDHSK